MAEATTSANGRRPRNPRAKMDYPFQNIPAAGKTIEVAPGVIWIRMPLPFTLDHINLWAIRDGEGWAVVDTGTQTQQAVDAWQGIIADVFDGLPITRVIVTHMHPDHVGMAGWLARRFSCRLWMTRLEYLTCRVLVADTGREAPADGVEFYRRAGWSDEALESYRARFGGFGKYVYALPDTMQRLRDGQTLRIGEHDWQIVVGNGHSPEHACLYSASLKLFISGDQVLPRISSNVSVFPTEPEADPLGDWIDSLAKLAREVPDDVLVLPSHNEPFRGLHDRIKALERGHDIGLERLLRTLKNPCRVIDTFGALFARRIEGDSALLGMASGEAIAHLNYLLVRGQIVMSLDENGVAWYQTSDDAQAVI